jgi:hypothetical protein
MVGGKIAQLEARKRLAVEREDYDLAKALKADIEKLRNAGEAAAGVGAGGASPGTLEYYRQQQQQQQQDGLRCSSAPLQSRRSR